MHIHKIETEKYQEFLLQERKDPITGDLIRENDKVVFCASCKSVFLVDTWLYLDEKHCEQSETLEKFPSISTLILRDEILFYNFLENSDSLIKSTPAPKIPLQVTLQWKYKSRKLSSFHSEKFSLIILILQLFFFGLMVASAFNGYLIIVLISLLSMLLSISIPYLRDNYYGKRLKTAHKFFKRESFFITHQTIGFSEKYGKTEYTFPYKNIDKIIFKEAAHFLAKDSISIFYIKENQKQVISVALSSVFHNRLNFLDAFQYLASNLSKPIELKLYKQKYIDQAKKMIEKRKANFILIID
ncbi:hypothetical protein ACE193_02325 [Bernardetia sp. OM2101]|uniref:hypothetical protein n=1 Tax=Bernardetia sp. OM2101 TaxID=3344876 RepID=UPI0035D0FF96